VVLRRSLVQSAGLYACVLVVAAAGLGLTVAQPASASCAGPQLKVQQDDASITPRRVGEGSEERLLYDVDRDRTLHVEAFNLTFGCNDTHAGSAGCGGPPSAPTKPLPPIQDVVLRLEQEDRRWMLARLDPGLSDDLDVRVPVAVHTGRALLMITDPENGDYAELTLVLS